MRVEQTRGPSMRGRGSSLAGIFIVLSCLFVPTLAIAAPGDFVDVFVSSGSGGLDSPDGMLFGPDGNLYVASDSTDEVLRYDGVTGAFIDVFASGDGLERAQGIAFGPDGNLYVTEGNSDEVLRFDGATGTFIDVFASGGVVSFLIGAR